MRWYLFSPCRLTLSSPYLTDIVERFQLALMMAFIAIRNLIELSGTEFDFSAAVPDSFKWIPGHGLAWTILSVGLVR